MTRDSFLYQLGRFYIYSLLLPVRRISRISANNMRPTFSAKSIDDSHCDRTTKISGSKQSLISGKKVIYDSIPGDYTRMYPVKTYYKNKLQPDFLQENQRTYYPFGKLATETGRNGVSTVYLWTKDNGSYPVAK